MGLQESRESDESTSKPAYANAAPRDGTSRTLRETRTTDGELAEEMRRASCFRLLEAGKLLDGTWLHEAAVDNASRCVALTRGRPLIGHAVRKLTWASACSGSEGPAFLMNALEQCLRERGYDCQFVQAFACEVSEEKRKWISLIMQHGDCLSRDTDTDEAGDKAEGAAAAASSGAAGHVGACGHVRAAAAGHVGQNGTAGPVDYSRYPCIFKNIADLAGDKEVTCRGYEGQSLLVDSHAFGLPAHRSSQWVEQHMAYAAAAKLRWGQQPPEQLRSNRWYKTLTKREQDLLPLVQAVMPDCLFRDVSQNVSRVNVTTLTMDKATERMIHVAPTLLPKQLLWMDEAVAGRDKGGRLVLGREAMLLQGFPINPFLAKLEDVLPQMAWFPSEALMFDLAGNAMSLPVILAVLQAGFASLTWKASVMMADETPVALDEEVDSAVALATAAAELTGAAGQVAPGSAEKNSHKQLMPKLASNVATATCRAEILFSLDLKLSMTVKDTFGTSYASAYADEVSALAGITQTTKDFVLRSSGIEPDSMKLTFKRRTLEDADTLESLKAWPFVFPFTGVCKGREWQHDAIGDVPAICWRCGRHAMPSAAFEEIGGWSAWVSVRSLAELDLLYWLVQQAGGAGNPMAAMMDDPGAQVTWWVAVRWVGRSMARGGQVTRAGQFTSLGKVRTEYRHQLSVKAKAKTRLPGQALELSSLARIVSPTRKSSMLCHYSGDIGDATPAVVIASVQSAKSLNLAIQAKTGGVEVDWAQWVLGLKTDLEVWEDDGEEGGRSVFFSRTAAEWLARNRLTHKLVPEAFGFLSSGYGSGGFAMRVYAISTKEILEDVPVDTDSGAGVQCQALITRGAEEHMRLHMQKQGPCLLLWFAYGVRCSELAELQAKAEPEAVPSEPSIRSAEVEETVAGQVKQQIVEIPQVQEVMEEQEIPEVPQIIEQPKHRHVEQIVARRHVGPGFMEFERGVRSGIKHALGLYDVSVDVPVLLMVEEVVHVPVTQTQARPRLSHVEQQVEIPVQMMQEQTLHVPKEEVVHVPEIITQTRVQQGHVEQTIEATNPSPETTEPAEEKKEEAAAEGASPPDEEEKEETDAAAVDAPPETTEPPAEEKKEEEAAPEKKEEGASGATPAPAEPAQPEAKGEEEQVQVPKIIVRCSDEKVMKNEEIISALDSKVEDITEHTQACGCLILTAQRGKIRALYRRLLRVEDWRRDLGGGAYTGECVGNGLIEAIATCEE
ncbi:hypothetical protein AK812_SmicGene43434 [Symbiodinium microadriaticum]|uniref:Uncharacterized protein n=1 Tax=Symbiodinium microadriaticum TaxID=2951 RepID=A0A1Q9C116_SYMMI|nr:hypothetical protein AK812_SmicGene43434 [Symbiodinium microadriaticum]